MFCKSLFDRGKKYILYKNLIIVQKKTSNVMWFLFIT